jgi:nucleoside-diphosphate-sugar epimerase
MSAPTVVITGATGFVGSAVVLEMLGTTDYRLLCLVRPSIRETARTRLRETLRAAAVAYGREDLIPAVEARCEAVAGDLASDACGVEPRVLKSCQAFVHCAASLRYEERHRSEIMATNVAGTRNALALAEAAGIEAFHHVSTAYVAGDRCGYVAEGPVPAGTKANNCYEESKIAAESLVAAASIGTRQILRPSVVIGHSRTLETTSSFGLYGFVGALWRLDRRVEELLGGLLRFRPVRFEFSADHQLNLIPIDAVAEAIARLIASPSPGASYHHVANLTPPAIGEALGELCLEMGLSRPEFSVPRANLSSIDLRVSEATRFYQSYLRNPKTFGTENTERVVGRDILTWQLDPEKLLPYGRWYLERLRREGDRAYGGRHLSGSGAELALAAVGSARGIRARPSNL